MPIDVLFVCTANICRSPVAERLSQLRSRVPDSWVRFTSAGTHARPGLPIDPPSARALAELGGDAVDHASRLLDRRMLEEATLVLTATTEHRDFTLRKHPSGMRKTFTMKEFVRLGRGIEPAVGPDDVERVIVDVAGQRGLVRSGGPQRDDIVDPYGKDPSESMRAAVEVSLAVDGVLDLLGIRAQREEKGHR